MPETIATAVSPVLNLLMTLLTPLTWLFSQWKKLLGHFVHSSESDAITEGELITMVSEAENDVSSPTGKASSSAAPSSSMTWRWKRS